MEATLQMVLSAREERVRLQEEMRKAHGCAVLSFTMNIAGPVKISPLIERAFDEGLHLLSQQLPLRALVCRDVRREVTGCQALMALRMDAVQLKRICTSIEDASPLGRLFDMDVIDADGMKLSRESQRGCLVCGKPGRFCAAGRLHSVEALQEATNCIMTDYFAQKDTEELAQWAVQSLIDEVHTTPKPGLVDDRNAGSHSDMDVRTFIASARALKLYFMRCVQIGRGSSGDVPERTFAVLRQEGLAAEKIMYLATGGVNTHKGAIFSMGIVCGALGRLWTAEKTPVLFETLSAECARMTKNAMEADFAAMDVSTAGARYYHETGCRGVRGEAAAGFPAVFQTGLPAFYEGLHHGFDREAAGVRALLHLIVRTEDSALYHRGGAEGIAWAKEKVGELLSDSPYPEKKQLEMLDDAFIARNLSPGGSADLLALVFLVDHLQTGGFVTGEKRICQNSSLDL